LAFASSLASIVSCEVFFKRTSSVL
jgi:hypothetical protein